MAGRKIMLVVLPLALLCLVISADNSTEVPEPSAVVDDITTTAPTPSKQPSLMMPKNNILTSLKESVSPNNIKEVLNSLNGETIVKSVKSLVEAEGVANATELLVRKGPEIIVSFKSLFKGVGGECKFNNSCPGSSFCDENICKCKPNYVTSSDNSTCLSVATKLGDGCREDVQCTAGLEKTVGKTSCINYNCTCAIQHILNGGWCIGQHSLGTACITDKDCEHAVQSKCEQGVCACPKSYISAPREDKCIPLAKSMSDECEEDSQCTQTLGNAHCKDSKCKCLSFNHIVSGKCVPQKGLGSNCTINDECRKPEEEQDNVRRGCVNNKCICVKGVREEDICTSGGRGTMETFHTSIILVIALVVATWMEP